MNKIRFISIFFILFFFTNTVSATFIDSLKRELKKAKEDTNKVKLLINIADNYYNLNLKTARNYANQSLKLATKLNYTHGRVSSLNLIGSTYDDQGEYNLALESFKKSLRVPNNTNSFDLAQLYVGLGNIYLTKADYAQAINYYTKAVHIFGDKFNQHNKAIILMNIGLVFKKQENYKKALFYNEKALAIFKKQTNSEFDIIDLENNIAAIYLLQKKYTKLINLCLSIIEKSEKIQYKYGVANASIYLGLVYIEKSQFDKAIHYFTKSIAINKEIDNLFGLSHALSGLSDVYAKTNQNELAINYIKKAMSIFKDKDMLEEFEGANLKLSKIYKKNNSFKEALHYYEIYSTLKDSIYNEVNAQKINDALTKYETEKKEKAIVLLKTNIRNKKKDQEILNAKIKNRNNIILGVSSVFVLLLITLYLLYTKRQLVLKNIHQEELNSQRNLTTKAIVQAQEKEQTRIAKDLHDSIGTFLSTLKINLQLFHEFIPKPKVEIYKNALNLIDQISAELRNIMRNLSNEVLNNQGVCHAIHELIEQINELNTAKIDFHVVGEIQRLDENTEHNLYRITQELFNNCIKYAHAKSVSLQLIEEEKTLVLMYEDDGVGFDVSLLNDLNPKHGMGLKNIKNRVHFLEGTIHIESTPNSGTVFIIEVPKKYV